METNKTTRKFKWFWAWQDNKREEWLRQMSLDGWHLEDIGKLGLFFNFSKGEARQYTYRLDFRVENEEKTKEYLEFLHDAEWEHVISHGGWHYFRKPTSSDGTNEIFTDDESKVNKYRRLITSLAIIYPGYIIIFFAKLERYPEWFALFLVSFYAFLTIFISISIIGLLLRIKELQSEK